MRSGADWPFRARVWMPVRIPQGIRQVKSYATGHAQRPDHRGGRDRRTRRVRWLRTRRLRCRGGSSGSPGVLSGNTIQLPVDIPVNACGNTVNVVGLLNPASGNDCANTSKPRGGHHGGSHHHGGGASAEGVRAIRPVSAPATMCRSRSTCRSTPAATASRSSGFSTPRAAVTARTRREATSRRPRRPRRPSRRRRPCRSRPTTRSRRRRRATPSPRTTRGRRPSPSPRVRSSSPRPAARRRWVPSSPWRGRPARGRAPLPAGAGRRVTAV